MAQWRSGAAPFGALDCADHMFGAVGAVAPVADLVARRMKRTLDLGPLFERYGHHVPAGELVITVWGTKREAQRYGDEDELLAQLAKLEAFLERVAAPPSHPWAFRPRR